MIRPSALVWLLVSVTACLDPHPQNQVIDKTNCYLCHVKEYDATGQAQFPNAPPHSTSGCSTQCADCHTTQKWTNGLGGCMHPEANFPLTGASPHVNIKCTDCHSEAITAATGATSVAGANTDCISCHPNDSTQQQNHRGVTYDSGPLTGQPYAYSTSDHRFCLDCHPKGLAIGHGPGNPFVLPHHGAACTQCHDYASGLGHQNGADVLCVTSGCHRDAHHSDTSHHPGCLDAGCHPDGLSHGG